MPKASGFPAQRFPGPPGPSGCTIFSRYSDSVGFAAQLNDWTSRRQRLVVRAGFTYKTLTGYEHERHSGHLLVTLTWTIDARIFTTAHRNLALFAR